MITKLVIKENTYFDSVALMVISQKLKEMAGVSQAIAGMGTDLNKELVEKMGLARGMEMKAGPNDLLLAVEGTDEKAVEAAILFAEGRLKARAVTGGNNREKNFVSLNAALRAQPSSNVAVISLPGAYAAQEAHKALDQNLHVMMFSDNVTLQDEIALKNKASAKGLLMMGPDCGTAMINHVPLCFANQVRSGSIGIVAASGTGAQEVSVVIHRLGGGVSQIIGTGGRDLHSQVGGLMTLDAIQALEADPETTVIVVISKPPSPDVMEKVLHALKQGRKPKVVCFLGGDPAAVERDGLYAGVTLEDTAKWAVSLALKKDPENLIWAMDEDGECATCSRRISEEKSRLRPDQKYIRGLYTGGTLCYEAVLTLEKHLGAVYSNLSGKKSRKLLNMDISEGHTLLDLGDDAFTVGRPHPMIDPSLRLGRLLEEAKDPETAVVLLDVVLGWGSHGDPAGMLAPVIREAKEIAARRGGHLAVVASICGTDLDRQNCAEQRRKLSEAGVILAQSNIRAVLAALEIVR